MTPDELLEIIRHCYPNEENVKLAQELGISESALKTIASRNGIQKTLEYRAMQHGKLVAARKETWEKNIKPMDIGIIEQNIIVGSLLGDGSLALYGRSKNARYREHGTVEQLPYRAWKAAKLSKQGFRLSERGQLTSTSHPYFTYLYQLFYSSGQKALTTDNLQLLNHLVGLACLYLDDGSLVIDSSRTKRQVLLFPRIYLYSLSYSCQENELLASHLHAHFGVTFKTKKHPDGSGCMLEINRRKDVVSFINLIKPYVLEIPALSYKIDLMQQLTLASQRYTARGYTVTIAPLEIEDTYYTSDDVKTIIDMKNSQFSDQEIAAFTGRSYWGIVDKIRRLRQEGLL